MKRNKSYYENVSCERLISLADNPASLSAVLHGGNVFLIKSSTSIYSYNLTYKKKKEIINLLIWLSFHQHRENQDLSYFEHHDYRYSF